MEITITPVQFRAIRVPLKEGTQNNLQAAKEAVMSVVSRYNPSGISTKAYRIMYFESKAQEKLAEDLFQKEGVKYTQSDIINNEINPAVKHFWAENGRFPNPKELLEETKRIMEFLS